MLRVVSAPAEGLDLVTLAEVKAQLRLEHSDEDDLLQTITAVAVEQVEALTQRRYLTQTLEWVLQCWPRRLLLPVAGPSCSPTATVAWVKYVDLNGVQQTLDPATYDVRPVGQGTLILPKRWVLLQPLLGDAPEPLVVRFTLGSDDPAPPSVRLAALLNAENLYDNRAAAEPPAIVQSLLTSELWEA